jgi:hypothetical protein
MMYSLCYLLAELRTAKQKLAEMFDPDNNDYNSDNY